MPQSRTVFRRLEEKDIYFRSGALGHLDVLTGISIEMPISEGATKDWFDRVVSSNSRRDFVLEFEDIPVGFSGLVQIDSLSRIAELYIFVSPEHQGRGFGAKLLRDTISFAKLELNLRKITLFVNSVNIRACRMYESCGFSREGHLKDQYWHRGEYVSKYIYSVFLDTVAVDRDIFYGNMR